jgi:hypothetical protein
MVLGRGLVEPFPSNRNAMVRLNATHFATQVVMSVIRRSLLAPYISTLLCKTFSAVAGFTSWADRFAEWSSDRMAPHKPGGFTLGEDHQTGVVAKYMVVSKDSGDRISIVEEEGTTGISQEAIRECGLQPFLVEGDNLLKQVSAVKSISISKDKPKHAPGSNSTKVIERLGLADDRSTAMEDEQVWRRPTTSLEECPKRRREQGVKYLSQGLAWGWLA